MVLSGRRNWCCPRCFTTTYRPPPIHGCRCTEHRLSDVGSLSLASVLVLAVAAVCMERRIAYTALAASLVFAVPHFVFHAAHLEHFPPADAVAQTVVLAIAVLI